jgi:hypothetical protein
MRALFQFPSSCSFQAGIGLVRRATGTRRQAVMLLLSFLAVITLGVRAVGNEEEHPKPRIENFQVFFDGIDQYSVYGEVVNCDDLDNIPVTLGGVFEGYSTETGFDGVFFLMIIHEDATGQMATAKATCHSGVTSNTTWADLF